MNALFQIDIPKRSSACCKGQEKLMPGMDYYSLLLEEESGLVRKDYCVTCWVGEKQEGQKGHTYWRSHIEPKPEDNKSLAATKQMRALALLKELLQTHHNETEIFVLALYLTHARKLLLRKEFEKEGCWYGLYEIAHQDEFLTIKKIALSQIEVKTTQNFLAAQLTSHATRSQ